MLTNLISLTFLFYTARTTWAAAFPKQSPGLWANGLQDNIFLAISRNTTLGRVPNASSFLNFSGFAVICLTAPPVRRPIIMTDYYEAVQQILIRDDALVLRRFDLGPGGSDRRNFRWRGGQCTIAFFNRDPLRTDAFPIILVAHVAALIAEKCVTEAKGYFGGVAQVGPNRGIVGVGNTPPGIESDESATE